MKKPLVFMIASLTADGLIATHADHYTDWTSKEDKRLFVKLTKEAGVMIMGKTTFDTFPKVLPGRKHVVYSRQQFEHDPETTEVTSLSPAGVIEKLANEGYERIAVIGGQQIFDLFLSAGVVDELYLTIEPQLFGTGISLLKTSHDRRMTLVETSRLGENGVFLHYSLNEGS